MTSTPAFAAGVPPAFSAGASTAPARMCASDAPARAPVFVAGASGRVGRRIVRALASAQVPVRAGCRDAAWAKEAVGELPDGAAVVEYVPFDLGAMEKLGDSVGGAEVVVSALGSVESLNLLSFAKVDGFGVAALMRAAAELREVRTLMIVSSIGVGNPFGFPAALLNLFGGVLLWKGYSERVAREEARKTGKDFFVVRPGGMERAQDGFGDTHNVKLEPDGSKSGGVISRQQVAEIVTAAILNPDAARNKTVEATAATTNPKLELSELLQSCPADSV